MRNLSLPIRFDLRFNAKMSMLMIIGGAAFIACGFLPITSIEKDGLFIYILMNFGAPIMGILAIAAFFFSNILKRNYINIDEDKLIFNQIFKTKTIFWEDIVDISTYTLNSHEFIGFITKEKSEKNADGGFFRSINSSMGGDYSISIPLKQISNYSADEAMVIIKDLHDKALLKNVHSNNEENFTDENQSNGNVAVAFITSFLFAFGTSLIYALILSIARINIVILPVIGTIGSYYYFVKFLKPTSHRIYFRFYHGALGIFTVLAARIILIYLTANNFSTVGNPFSLIGEYLEYLSQNFETEFVFVLLALVSCGTGFFVAGPSIPFFKKFSRPFLKRMEIFISKKKSNITQYIRFLLKRLATLTSRSPYV